MHERKYCAQKNLLETPGNCVLIVKGKTFVSKTETRPTPTTHTSARTQNTKSCVWTSTPGVNHVNHISLQSVSNCGSSSPYKPLDSDQATV